MLPLPREGRGNYEHVVSPLFLWRCTKYLELSCGTFCALSLWEGWGEGQVLRIMIGLLP